MARLEQVFMENWSKKTSKKLEMKLNFKELNKCVNKWLWMKLIPENSLNK